MIDGDPSGSHYALVFVQPREQAFDLLTPPIPPENTLILGLGPDAITPMRREHEWKARNARNNHELRTFAPLGLSHCEAPFFATTKVPSIKHSERLILHRSSGSHASAPKSRLPHALAHPATEAAKTG